MTFGKVPSKHKVYLLDGSSSSRHIKHVYYSIALNSLDASCRTILSATRIQKQQQQDKADLSERISAILTEQVQQLLDLQQSLLSNQDECSIAYNKEISNENYLSFDDVLTGRVVPDISHAGEEFESILELAENMLSSNQRSITVYYSTSVLY